jgi:general secretion pathway protein D
MPLRNLLTPILLVLATSLGGTSYAAPFQEADEDVPTIQAEGDFYVINISEVPGKALTLEQFIKLCQQATGYNFTYTDTTATQLKKEVRLIGTKRVPKRDFYSWFQIMLVINEFGCIEIGPPRISVLLIQGLDGGGTRSQLKMRAKWVTPDEIEQYADQPAVLVTTVVNLKNSDVRQLSTNLRPLLADPTTENIMGAGNNNSLIITGFGSKIASIVKLLHVIDEESAPLVAVSPVFDIVPMEFASADDIATLMDELLQARNSAITAASTDIRSPNQPATPSRPPETKVLVQARTNSLLIVAMPDEMPSIKEMIARLDVDVIEPERNYHIYALQNVSAEEIAQTLGDFLEGANDLAESGTGTGGRNQPSTSSNKNDVVVIPDEVTNSLLIAANKTRYVEVIDMIKTLDRRQDQVLIETALIELSGSDLYSMGVELGLASLPGIGEIGGFGVTSFGLSSIDDINPVDGIPDSKVPNLGTGFTGGLLDGDDFSLPILLSLMETKDNANVLNIPSVLVSNNSSATVSTEDEQPYNDVTALGSSASTQDSFGGYEKAGITMKISPSISASRYLRLGIELEISNFRAATIANSPPPRTTRKLVTQVNIPDGDTMVIGGIISDNQLESTKQIPILGDLPIVGFLFRSSSTTGNRTSLYFFVTPHILHDEDFADLNELSYQAKIEAAETIGYDRIRMIDTDFSGDDGLFSLDAFALPQFQRPDSGEVDGNEVGISPQRRNDLLRAAKQNESTPTLEEAANLESSN